MTSSRAPHDDEVDINDEDRTLKIAVVGDGSSGKTSMCQRLARDDFDANYHQTIGLDFFSRRLTLPGDINVLLQVWDIGGQSIAGEMVDKYIFGAHCVLVVYDVTNTHSFDDVSDWISVVKRVTKQQPKPPEMILIGNKIDLESKRVVTVDMHNKIADKYDMGSAYTSAKTGDSVIFTFREAAARVLKIQLQKVDQDADVVIIQGEVAPEAAIVRRRTNTSQPSGVCSLQ